MLAHRKTPKSEPTAAQRTDQLLAQTAQVIMGSLAVPHKQLSPFVSHKQLSPFVSLQLSPFVSLQLSPFASLQLSSDLKAAHYLSASSPGFIDKKLSNYLPPQTQQSRTDTNNDHQLLPSCSLINHRHNCTQLENLKLSAASVNITFQPSKHRYKTSRFLATAFNANTAALTPQTSSHRCCECQHCCTNSVVCMR
jgi:hypothetical protein